MTLAHYKFQQRLKDKSREFPLCRVEIVSEAFTSKTCGRCGKINETLGGKAVFECANCQLKLDRDIHAARNILLRALEKEGGKKIPSHCGLPPSLCGDAKAVQ